MDITISKLHKSLTLLNFYPPPHHIITMENQQRIAERAYYLAQEDSTRTDEENWRMAEAAEHPRGTFGYILGYTQKLGSTKFHSLEDAMTACRRVNGGGVTMNLKSRTFTVRRATTRKPTSIKTRSNDWHEISWLL